MTSDLRFEDLVGIFAGRANASGGLASRARFHEAEVVLPAKDKDDVAYEALDDEQVVDLLGGELLISYQDAAGQASRRAVGLHGLRLSEDGGLGLLAYCLESHGARAFRVRRISAATDLLSNHTIEGAEAVANHFDGLLADARADNSLAYRQRRALKILLFLARCDGEQHPSETAVILGYLKAVAEEEGVQFDPAGVEARLESVQVDEVDFARALRALRQDKDALIAIGYYARRLIAADGAVSREEAAFEAELEKALERIRPR
ncbi:MAG: hypothetical protein AAF495_20805 [Pseudomonadota bacterium]